MSLFVCFFQLRKRQFSPSRKQVPETLSGSTARVAVSSTGDVSTVCTLDSGAGTDSTAMASDFDPG